jgi:hypothetical protein
VQITWKCSEHYAADLGGLVEHDAGSDQAVLVDCPICSAKELKAARKAVGMPGPYAGGLPAFLRDEIMPAPRTEDIERIQELQIALHESVKLQSHYAMLLNGWDGGKRMQFASAQAWLDRSAR